MAYDGTLTFNTKIDSDGIDKGTKQADKSISGITASFKKLQDTIASAFSGKDIGNLGRKTEEHTSKIDKANEAVKKQEILVQNLILKYESLMKGETTPQSLKTLENDLKRTQKEYDSTILKNEEFFNELERLKSIQEIDIAVHGSTAPEITQAIQETENGVIETAEKLDELTQKSDRLKSSISDIKLNPENSAEAVKLNQEIGLGSDKLERLNNEADILNKNLNNVGKEGSKSINKVSDAAKNSKPAFSEMGKGIENTVKKIKNLIVAAFVFNVIRKSLSELKKYLSSILMTNAQFVNSLGQIKGNLLTAFQPIYTAILPLINTFMSALAKATAYIAAFVSSLFGTTVSQAAKGAEALNREAEAIKGTGKAANAALKSLASFDKINKLSENSANNNASIASSIFPTDGLKVDTKGIDKFAAKIKKMLSSIAAAAAPTIKAMKNLWASMEPFRKFVWQGLVDFFNRCLVPIGRWLLGEGLPRFFDITAKLFENIDWPSLNASIANLWDALVPFVTFVLADALLDFYELFLVPIGSWVLGEGLPRFADITANILQTIDWNLINDALARLWEVLTPFLVSQIGEGLLWFYEKVILPMVEWAAEELIPSALDLISAAIEALGKIIDSAKPALIWFWDNILVPFGKWAGESIINGIKWLTEKLKDFSDWAGKNQETMELISSTILGFFAGIVTYIVGKKIVTLITSLGTALATFGAKGFIAAIGAAAPALALGLLVGAIFAIAAVWDKLSKGEKILAALAVVALAAAAAIAIFHTTWTAGLAAVAIGLAIAGLVTTFLLVKDKLNVSSVMPDLEGATAGSLSEATSFASTVGGSSPLPRLATGTVVPANYGEFAAILGDNKRETEIVSPLSTMKQAVKEALAESGYSGNGDININFTGSLAQLARILKPEIERENRRATAF